MFRILRPIVVFGVAGSASLVAFHFTGGAHGSNGDPSTVAPRAPLEAYSVGGGYALAELDLLETTLYHVEESYVQPDRIDYEKMFVAALEAVERRVPAAMFRRQEGGKLVHMEIGDYRTVLEVAPITSRRELQRELKSIAAVLQQRLAAEDIPAFRDDEDPYAQVEYALVNGVLGTLDPHSLLLPPDDSKRMDTENKGEFGGLGITIVERQGRLTVEYPLKDTPAEKAGLLPDDHIVRIDGESTINMGLEEAVSKLRGLVGAPVTIEIMRDGLTQPLPVEIVRARIKLNPVKGELLEGGVGYVGIDSFHANVQGQLHDELTRLNRESGGMRGLILDMRGNPGGYLNQAVAVAETFLQRGVIVSTVDGQNRKRDEEVAHAQGTEPDYPIVVLIDANSASASEIVAGALRYNDRAVIVGERTFGKGSVQNLHSFHDDSKLKLTISKYLTPGDRSIQSIGIPADIALIPTVVEEREVDGEMETFAALFWRDRVRREADLDKHLERVIGNLDEPAYELRFRRPGEAAKRRSADLDLGADFQVQFARDLLLATPSARRADMLGAAASVVVKHERDAAKDIVDAFRELGIDWSRGPTAKAASIEVEFDLGPDGKLVAGAEEMIGLEVTNTGDKPLYQLVAISESDNDVLDGREFVFGKLDPGETRRFHHRVKLVHGYPTELTPVKFVFRDSGNTELVTKQARLPVDGQDLPIFSWSWQTVDASGDGQIDVGEAFRLDLSVTNIGNGPSIEAYARAKNKSGRALDIEKGTLEFGYHVDPQGERCEAVEAATDKTSAVYPKDCSRQLAPNQTWQGSFEFVAKEDLGEAFGVELSIGDARAYDHASIVRGEHYSYFTNREQIQIPIGAPAPGSNGARVPPKIEITSRPGSVVEVGHITVSGKVTDDVGLQHVMVYKDGDKVFYQGSGRGQAVKSVPFTADLELQPGINTVTVLVTDRDGYTSTESVVTFYLTDELQAQVGSLRGAAEATGKP